MPTSNPEPETPDSPVNGDKQIRKAQRKLSAKARAELDVNRRRWLASTVVKPTLTIDDVKAALHMALRADAGTVTPEAIQSGLEELNDALHHMLGLAEAPRDDERRETAEALRDFARASREVLVPIAQRLQGGGCDPIDGDALGRHLGASTDRMLSNLVCSAREIFAGDDAARGLADILHGVQYLSRWADAAAQQIKVGIDTEAAARPTSVIRSKAQEYGFATIDVFVSMTGRRPQFSRRGIGERSGQVDGPMPRFIQSIFSATRRILLTDTFYDLRKLGPAIEPSPDTIDSWIRIRRRTERK